MLEWQGIRKFNKCGDLRPKKYDPHLEYFIADMSMLSMLLNRTGKHYRFGYTMLSQVRSKLIQKIAQHRGT